MKRIKHFFVTFYKTVSTMPAFYLMILFFMGTGNNLFRSALVVTLMFLFYYGLAYYAITSNSKLAEFLYYSYTFKRKKVQDGSKQTL